MTTRTATALILVALLTGCPTVIPSEPSATASEPPATPGAAATARPSPTPMPMSPTVEPTATPTMAPTATAVASNQCTHPQGVYTVSYPTDWYSNAGSDTYIACTAFGPQPLGEDPATDPGVAITLIAEPNLGWNDPLTPLSGEFAGYRTLVDEAATVGGRRAWVRVYELTLAQAPDNNVGDLSISYSVELENDWFVTGLATANPDAYPDLRDVLVTMLAGLDIP